MAVSWVSSAESIRTLTTDPYTFSYTVGATAKGLALAIGHGTETTDLIVSVDIGGVTMDRVVSISDGAGELGRSYLYFVGTGLPAAGAQTVTVDITSASGTDISFTMMEVAADADTEVIDSDSTSGDLSNVQLTLQYGGRTAISVANLYSGLGSVPIGTLLATCSVVQTHDFAAFTTEAIRQTTPDTADFTIGWSSSSLDDAAYVACAISEVAAAAPGPVLRRRPRALFVPMGMLRAPSRWRT